MTRWLCWYEAGEKGKKIMGCSGDNEDEQIAILLLVTILALSIVILQYQFLKLLSFTVSGINNRL